MKFDNLQFSFSKIWEILAPTVPPESIYPFTEVLLRMIRRLTPRSRLGNDAACRNLLWFYLGFLRHRIPR